MSMTFTAEFVTSDIVGYRITCVCGCRSERYPTYSDAEAAYQALPGFTDNAPHLPVEGCDLDPMDRVWLRPSIQAELAEEPPYAQFCDANGGELLNLLGLVSDGGDCAGSIAADDMYGRVLMAQALAGSDPGRPPVAITADGAMMLADEALRDSRVGGTGPDAEGRVVAVDCGRREGYFDDRLIEIAEVALWAQARGRNVQWS